MVNLEGIKNIIFDLGGVILTIDYQLTVEEFKKLGVDDFDEIFSQFKQSSLSDDFEVGKISESQFYEGIKIASGGNFSFAEFQKAWNAMLLDLPQKRIEILKALSTSYRLFLFSNTNETHYNQFASLVSQDFDSIFEKCYYSHRFGKRKPDEDAFISLMNESNLVSGETLFLDDSIQHIHSAVSIGISAILVQEKPIEVLFQ